MNSTTKQNLLAMPGIGMALVPKLVCPACWPAYAGLLSTFGLGFLGSTKYLLPLTAVFLLVAVGLLAFRARRRRGYLPFILGGLAASLLMYGKFSLSNPVLYAGLGLLIMASVWNSWPLPLRCECAPAAEFEPSGALQEKRP